MKQNSINHLLFHRPGASGEERVARVLALQARRIGALVPNNYYPSQTFNSPLLSSSDALKGDLRERLATREPGRLIALGFSVQLAEVALVNIYRTTNGTTHAS